MLPAGKCAKQPRDFVHQLQHSRSSNDLARDEERRSGIKPRTSKTGDGVCAARTGRQEREAEMVRCFGIVLGGNSTGLFVKIADRNDRRSSQGFVEMHGAAADDQKGMLNALIGEKLYDVGGEFHCRYLS